MRVRAHVSEVACSFPDRTILRADVGARIRTVRVFRVFRVVRVVRVVRAFRVVRVVRAFRV